MDYKKYLRNAQKIRRGKLKKYTPNDFAKLALEYFEWVEQNPIEVKDIRGRDNEEVTLKKLRPMSVVGFCIHSGIPRSVFYQYNSEGNPDYFDYKDILEAIAEAIRQQKLDGAIIGVFSNMIIARDLGLTDKLEHTTIQEQPLFSDDDNDDTQEETID